MLTPISVLMPTYNRAHVIRDSIDSVLRQSHPALELVVYDDGSEDGTENVVRSIDDPRLRYHAAKQNGGVAAARNELLRLARHEIACWQDSDDRSNIHRLALQLALMDRHPMVLSPFVWLSRVPADAWLHAPLPHHNVPSHPSAMFRVDPRILFDLRFSISGEDVNWTNRMQAEHGAYHLIERQLYYNRDHAQRIGRWKRDPKINAAWYERMSKIAGTSA